MKIEVNAVATKDSGCFILISGLIDEAEVYRANKQRSIDLS